MSGAGPVGPEPDPERGDWVAATGNAGKLAEIRAILADLPLRIRSLADFPGLRFPDEGDDYTENAVQKARVAAAHTGHPALGDDSGLEVDALGGRPGPHSARYGGPGLSDAQRVERLLEELAAVPEAERGARFVCVAARAMPDGAAATARGVCEGRILLAPRGEAGFGYDPIFAPEGSALSMAEVDPEHKNRISHRGRAFRALFAAPAGDPASG